MPEIKYKKCQICKFWNEGKPFSALEIRQQEKHGIGYDKYRCSEVDDFVDDPGYETEGVHTRYDFGCILWQKRELSETENSKLKNQSEIEGD